MTWRGNLILRWSAVAAYSALIFYLSSRSDLDTLEDRFEGLDKIEHGAAYVLWTWLFSSALASTWPGLKIGWRLALAGGFGTLYGASDEIHQMFVPLRTADAADLAADSVGSLLGAALHAAWLLAIRRRAPSPPMYRPP